MKNTARKTSHAKGKSARSTTDKLKAQEVTTHESFTAAVPLDQLERHPDNVRTTDDGDVSGLAASIRAQGLIQNLAVIPVRDASGGETGRYAVCAGGRRLRALLMLVKTGDLAADAPVDCRVYPTASPTEVSLAENIHRLDMHPADQFAAFLKMTQEGSSIDEIGARFGYSSHTVRQRLKLANVAPKLMGEFRAGRMDLGQITAMAVSEDRERQVRVWRDAAHWQRNPTDLRRLLTAGETPATDPRARFVGREAYEAAGGSIHEDLFVTDASGVYFRDAELLERLASAKLDDAAAALQGEGWAWCEVAGSDTSFHQLHRLQPSSRKATDAERAKMASLDAEATALEERLQDANLSLQEERTLEERYEVIQAERLAIIEGRKQWSAKVKKTAGAIVKISSTGELKIERGLLKPADKRAAARASRDAAKGNADESETSTPKTIPDSLALALSGQKTLALQALLQDRPDVALVLTVHALVLDTLYSDRWGTAVVQISTRPCYIDGSDDSACKAGAAITKGFAEARARLPETTDELLPWLFDQDQSTLLELLAVAVSRSVHAIQSKAGEPQAVVQMAARALALDMSEWWTPDGANYLARVPKALREAAVAEGAGQEAAGALKGLKKDACIQRSGELLAGKGWLPQMLRV